jgi:hypothetical protein
VFNRRLFLALANSSICLCGKPVTGVTFLTTYLPTSPRTVFFFFLGLNGGANHIEKGIFNFHKLNTSYTAFFPLPELVARPLFPKAKLL